MASAELTPASTPSQERRSVLRQVGRGLLTVALLLQGLFCVGVGVVAVWSGVTGFGSSPAYPGDWPWYLALAGGLFLATGGSASLISCLTLAQDRPTQSARRLRWISLWVTIAFDVLLPPSLLLLSLVATPALQPDVLGWAYWQFVLGLVALGVWTIARRPPFGWIGARAISIIALVSVVLITVTAVGGRVAANALSSEIRRGAGIGPCSIVSHPCWRTVDATTAEQAAARFGHRVAWLPAGDGLKPSLIHVGPGFAMEELRAGTRMDVLLISQTGGAPFCQGRPQCPSATKVTSGGTRVSVYPLPDGTQLELGWREGHETYRLMLESIDRTSPTLSDALAILGGVKYTQQPPGPFVAP